MHLPDVENAKGGDYAPVIDQLEKAGQPVPQILRLCRGTRKSGTGAHVGPGHSPFRVDVG
jgi:hypothetical protein